MQLCTTNISFTYSLFLSLNSFTRCRHLALSVSLTYSCVYNNTPPLLTRRITCYLRFPIILFIYILSPPFFDYACVHLPLSRARVLSFSCALSPPRQDSVSRDVSHQIYPSVLSRPLRLFLSQNLSRECLPSLPLASSSLWPPLAASSFSFSRQLNVSFPIPHNLHLSSSDSCCHSPFPLSSLAPFLSRSFLLLAHPLAHNTNQYMCSQNVTATTTHSGNRGSLISLTNKNNSKW